MEPEYFYQEVQRWSFGFENPNKAAVIFACLLPLCWWAWMAAWKVRRPWMRNFALLGSSGLFLALGICLLMTFSRGGLVAGMLALGYFQGFSIWRAWKRGAKTTPRNDRVGQRESGTDSAAPRRMGMLRHPKSWLSVLLIGLLAGVAVWSGLADRSATALGEDASVTNRFDLWKAGLQMAYENPAGFGSGRSGSEFMQWYQAPDRTEGYRTMVNSYLTFLVEQGWAIFTLVVFAALGFWLWTAPVPGHKFTEMATALRASILAFLISGVFSTTMEDAWLWILPACCAMWLIALRCWSRPCNIPCRKLGWAALGTLAIGIGLVIAGFLLSRGDPLTRTVRSLPEGCSVVGIEPKVFSKTIRFTPDAAVSGPLHGKLLRSLALEIGARILLSEDPGVSADLVVLAGEAANGPLPKTGTPLLLLAPAKIEEKAAASLLSRNDRILLLIPEIDEDGRSSFWKNLAEELPRKELSQRELAGVGTQVDWAWEQVTNEIREALAAKHPPDQRGKQSP